MAELSNIFLIRTNWLDRLFRVPKPDVSRWTTVSVRDASLWLYFLGIMVAFYASLTPWFLWSIYTVGHVMAALPIVMSFLMSRTLSRPIFTRQDYLYPTLAYAACLLTMGLLGGRNMNGFIGDLFYIVVMLSLFMLNRDDLSRLGDVLSKSMGVILVPSIAFYMLYLAGFPLPHHHLVNSIADYQYESFTFFLITDNDVLTLVPRFQSVFVEPAHMAMACIALLLTQVGQWRRWYNVTMLAAIVISFSLAGYVFLVIIGFGAAWMRGRAIMGTVLLLAAAIGIVLAASTVYNKGDNLVNNLIVQRLVIDDEGQMAGDNRVTGDFEKAFDKLAGSEKVLTGQGIEKMKQFEWGNAGYRVFIYSYGLVSVVMVVVFYLVFAAGSTNRRGAVLMAVVAAVSFIPHAMPLKLYFLIPLYILTFRALPRPAPEPRQQEDEAHGSIETHTD